MITQIQHLEGKKLYLSSTGYTGILEEFPTDFVGFVRSKERSYQKHNLLGIGPSDYYTRFNTKDFDALKEIRAGKYWPIPEQVSFFLPDINYNEWMQPLRTIKYMYFDIEVGTSRGRAPDWNRDPIIMIGAAVNDGPVMIFDEGDELQTIFAFLDYVHKQDPDFMVGYYSKGFDIPFILGRLYILKQEFPQNLHRIVLPAKFERQPNGYVDIDGRVSSLAYEALGYGRTNYDIFESSVKMDTSIKTKNRRMKTVGGFFDLTGIFDIEDDNKTDMLAFYRAEREKCQKYLDSDINLTRNLGNIYIPRVSALARMARTSMDFILNSKGRAVFARTFVAKAFIDRKIYPVLKNSRRNSEVFEAINNNYQGAFTDIRHVGRFQNTSKVDFSAMYPSIMVSFNISPDTVTFIGKEPLAYPEDSAKVGSMLGRGVLKDNYYPIKVHANNEHFMQLAVPDEQAGGYIVARIEKDRKGIIPTELDRLFKIRAEIRTNMKPIKKQMEAMKEAGKEKTEEYLRLRSEYVKLDSEQLGVKIAMNSIYGLSGNEHLEVGDITCAILITAFGREISHYCVSEIGDRAIEIDTDGVYINGDIDVDSLNQLLRKAILEKFSGFPFDPMMELALEKKGYDSLFIAMKNYVLRDPETKEVYVTGSSMKGSGKSPFVERLLSSSAEMLLDGTEPSEVYKKVQHMVEEERPDEDFKISMAIQKDLNEYESDGGVFSQMERLLDSIDENMKPAECRNTLEGSLRKEFKRLEKWLIKKGIKNEKNFPLLIDQWRNSVQKCKTIVEIVRFTEFFAAQQLGDGNRSPTSMNYRLYERAMKNGIQVLKGDSIDYYYALSENKEEMYTAANLARYPIDKTRYIRHVESTVQKMIQSVESQSMGTLF